MTHWAVNKTGFIYTLVNIVFNKCPIASPSVSILWLFDFFDSHRLASSLHITIEHTHARTLLIKSGASSLANNFRNYNFFLLFFFIFVIINDFLSFIHSVIHTLHRPRPIPLLKLHICQFAIYKSNQIHNLLLLYCYMYGHNSCVIRAYRK